MWVEKRAQLENNSPWAHSAPVGQQWQRGHGPPALPAQTGGTPRPGRTPGYPVQARGWWQLPGSHQTPVAHPVLRAGTGQWVPALQPLLGRGQLRSQSSCCARARDTVGNYGTAVKYKLEKNPLWRRGHCVSEPWGAWGRGAPAPCRRELPSGPLAWLFALPLFLGLHERERDR